MSLKVVKQRFPFNLICVSLYLLSFALSFFHSSVLFINNSPKVRYKQTCLALTVFLLIILKLYIMLPFQRKVKFCFLQMFRNRIGSWNSSLIIVFCYRLQRTRCMSSRTATGATSSRRCRPQSWRWSCRRSWARCANCSTQCPSPNSASTDYVVYSDFSNKLLFYLYLMCLLIEMTRASCYAKIKSSLSWSSS